MGDLSGEVRRSCRSPLARRGNVEVAGDAMPPDRRRGESRSLLVKEKAMAFDLLETGHDQLTTKYSNEQQIINGSKYQLKLERNSSALQTRFRITNFETQYTTFISQALQSRKPVNDGHSLLTMRGMPKPGSMVRRNVGAWR
jgi:hypothetical protein